MDCSMPGLPVYHQVPEFTQTNTHWVGDAIQPSHPLLSPSPTFNLSQHQGLFKWVSSSHQVAKELEFQLHISPSNEYSELISFRMDWFDLLAVQGTLESLFQHHNSKASILWCSASFIVQLSHPYMTTGKTIALTRWIFVGKVISMLFNMLSRFVITFLPRSKCLLICSVMTISISRASSQLRDPTWVSRIASRFFPVWATRKADAKCLFQCASAYYSAYHLAGSQSVLEGDSEGKVNQQSKIVIEVWKKQSKSFSHLIRMCYLCHSNPKESNSLLIL